MAALVYASTLALVTQGFVLMYKTTRVPNFSIGVLMMVGAYAAFTMKKIVGLPFYLSVVFACIFGTIVSLVISVGIIEPMIRRGRTLVEMTIVTIAIGLVMENLVQIVTMYFEDIFEGHRSHLHLKSFDIRIGGVPGGFLFSNLAVFASFLILRHAFKHTDFGLSFRAINENIELAQVQGINPVKNRIATWALAGGMASLSGALMGTWFCSNIHSGTVMMPTILAAALLGGMDSERGAIISSLIVGTASIVLPTYGHAIIGVWAGEYRFVIPLTVIVLVTLVSPNGILGTDLTTQPVGWIKRMDMKRALIILVVILCGITICSNVSERNRVNAMENLLDGFSGYNLTVREIPRGIDSPLGDLILFKERLVEYNISTVYVEPFTDSSTRFRFYYERNHVFWTTDVQLKFTLFCQYKIV
jgi:branched-chain amino acid transport system permease protein